MGEKLIVSADFLASDYAPQICLFTGDTEHVSHDPLRVMSGRPGYAPSTQPGVPAYEVWLSMPYTVAGRMLWSLDRINRSVGSCLAAAALPIALAMVWMECWKPITGHEPNRLAVVLILVLVTLAWWTLRRQLVSVRLLKEAAGVEIEFPRRLRHVQEAFRRAYAIYVEEGSPPPSERDPDEIWPDAVQPGWDESRHFPAIRE